MNSEQHHAKTELPVYLTVDTSTKQCSISLANPRKVIKVHSWQTNYNPTSELLPKIITALANSDLTPNDISALGVAVGPGGFSSIRTGVSVVKGLRIALEIPAVGFNTLEATAYSYIDKHSLITPVLSIGKGYFAWATYQVLKESLNLTDTPKIGHANDIVNQNLQNRFYCGEGVKELTTLLDKTSAKYEVTTDVSLTNRIYGLTQLVTNYFTHNPHKSGYLNPIYLKEPLIGNSYQRSKSQKPLRHE